MNLASNSSSTLQLSSAAPLENLPNPENRFARNKHSHYHAYFLFLDCFGSRPDFPAHFSTVET